MATVLERTVGSLRIAIDATLCVGFAECVDRAPQAFRLNADDVVEFADPDRVEGEQLLTACAACPVDALLVWDAAGAQLVPRGGA